MNVWVKENSLSQNNIILSYAYSDTVDSNYIISQSVEEDKKITKHQKISFVISKGADPDELIEIPELDKMAYSEIKKWITENKLTGAKLTQEYSDTIEKDKLISVTLKNIEEDEFTRSSNISIIVSKGKKPKKDISVEDFIGKDIVTVETWAELNKIKLVKNEVYSDLAIGLVVSQDKNSTEKLSENDTLTINVSKGKSVKVESLIGLDKAVVNDWATTNGITIVFKEIYHDTISKNKIINQNIKANSLVSAGDTIIVTVSLGKPYLKSFVASSIDDLNDWIYEMNMQGCNFTLKISDNRYYSETITRDAILNQDKTGYISLNSTINVILSNGTKVMVEKNYIGSTEEEVKAFCSSLNCIYNYTKNSKPIGEVIDIKIDNKVVLSGTYINSSDLIIVTISEGE